jgi:putative YphP/YqiW family bacilliredoxin
MYPEYVTAPMRQELVEAGFKELLNSDEVVAHLEQNKGTTLLVVNSVCGCAAGGARPGVKMAMTNSNRPDHTLTVFAGVHVDAVKKAREFMLPYPPSSPAIALFKDGQLVHILERHHIEGRSPEMIAGNLKLAFDQYCAN